MKPFASILGLLALLFLVLNGCEKKAVETTPEKLSFDIIEEQVLATSCAVSGCHSSTADASYAQHDLCSPRGLRFPTL